MRDIKFRAISAKGEMQYGLLTKDLEHSTAYWDEYPYRIHWHQESGGEANCPVRTETIGQYIGLKDKNGVEIFEGDIYETEFVGHIQHRVVEEGSQERDMPPIMFLEVVGNIYENPELLESE